MRINKLHQIVILFVICAGVQFAGQSQEQSVQKDMQTPPPDNSQVVAPEGQTTAASGSDMVAEAFVYLPRGRRDPFWDLLGNAKAGKDAKGRETISGIAGLMIEELELEGIIYADGKYYATMRGPDSRPYLVTVGENVYDGEIVKIDSHAVVFKKILTIAVGGLKERLISKRLNPEEEQEK